MPISNVLAKTNHHKKHHPGCNTSSCDHRIDIIWAKRHPQYAHIAVISNITKFDLCVANNESGEPGSLSYSSINWHEEGGYEGAYQFLNSTWLAAGGGKYASGALEATPAQQTAIFNSYEPNDPGAWPQTVPPCLKYN